jgi:hypothetical protein
VSDVPSPVLRTCRNLCSAVRTFIMRSSLALAFGLLAACGTDGGDDEPEDCATVTNDDTFVVGLEKAGMGGTLNFRMMSADPAPPDRGDNIWVFQINQMTSGVVGAPVDGASLEVTPFMPKHGHISPIDVGIDATADAGNYKLDPVNLWMPGVWETTIKATAGTTTDTVMFRFCVP